MASSSPLAALPPSVWASPEIEQAVARSAPGTIIAIARRAHRLRQEELGALTGFSQSAISRLESGGTLAYDTRVLRILQRVLGIPPRLLDLADEHPAPAFAPRAFDSQALLAGYAPAAIEVAASGTTPDDEVVRQLLVMRRVVNESENWISSDAMLPTVRTLYDFVERFRALATNDLRQDVLKVMASYAEFCGWLHLQTGDVAGAARWTGRALRQAQAAEHHELVAYSYRRMSQIAEIDGNEDEVLGLARAARQEAGVGPQIKAMTLQQEAKAHAAIGDDLACLTALDEAQELVAGIQPYVDDTYRLGSWFNEDHVEVQRAACCVRLGRTAEAIALYAEGRQRWAPMCLWGLGVQQAKLAFAHATTGNFDDAAAAGAEAVTLAKSTGSMLVVKELHGLSRWAGTPPIDDVLDALVTV